MGRARDMDTVKSLKCVTSNGTASFYKVQFRDQWKEGLKKLKKLSLLKTVIELARHVSDAYQKTLKFKKIGNCDIEF